MLRLTKPYINSAETEAVKHVLDSGWLAEGSVTAQFEAEFAHYVGSRYAVAVCNCTIALELCLRAEGIKKEHVSIPDFTHPATAMAIMNTGNTPVLCDVSLDSYNIKDCNTRVSIPVSWGGNPLNWYPRSMIVEDAACSLGSSVDGVKTGSRFTTCFSLHPRKIITTGEGAVITTNSSELAQKLRRLKNFGKGGGNYRFDDVRAAIGLQQLKKLPTIIKTRRELATVYNELLSDAEGLKTPQTCNGVVHTYQTYAVYLEKGNRDEIITRMSKKGVETQIGTYALHLLPQFRRSKRSNGLENSTLLHRHLLALPMAYDLTFDDQKHVVEMLRSELSKTSNNRVN